MLSGTMADTLSSDGPDVGRTQHIDDDDKKEEGSDAEKEDPPLNIEALSQFETQMLGLMREWKVEDRKIGIKKLEFVTDLDIGQLRVLDQDRVNKLVYKLQQTPLMRPITCPVLDFNSMCPRAVLS
jgi:hypothetical protein